ncbi:Transposon Tf2-6 polyprotein [Dictyocoela muelleri]|nr:Transposon Tf2-6 polyprotein [Dictyocoela muelleri]
MTDKMSLKIHKTDRKRIELANSTTTFTDNYIEEFLHVYNDQHSKIKERFYVLEGLNYPILLGMEFIFKNKLILDIKNKFIRIDDKEYELDMPNPTYEEYDQKLLEKTKIFDAITQIDKPLGEIVDFYRRKNTNIGSIDSIEHEIKIEGVFQPPKSEYPVPLAIRNDVVEHLKELKDNGIIVETDTSYISPAFFVRKSNGKLRMIIDYRKLNSITIKEHNFRPKLMDIFYSLNNKKIFSKIDLNQGFYQVKIRDEDIPKTGFRVFGTTYAFKRMPFGLTNAPYTFQKAINKILTGLKNVYCFIDDILIASPDSESHKVDVQNVLGRLFENNIAINFEKSKFGESEIEFLGHIISQKGIRPQVSKLESLKIKVPRTKKQLEKILGLVNWFRDFIPNLSEKLADFYNKLKGKNKSIVWCDNDTRNLMNIIDEIKKQNTLHHPDFDKDFELKCDASDLGIGAILTQDNKLIGLYSRKFRNSELNYTTIEKETIAILDSLKHFKSIIFTSHVNILTDNKNLTFEGQLSKRMSRWLLLLEEYNYTLQHVSCNDNSEADLLSRSMIIHQYKEIPEINKLNSLIQVLNTIKNDKMPENEKKTKITEILKAIHVLLIHPGRNKMMKTIMNYVKIKSLKRIISQICKNCNKCITEKDFSTNPVRTTFVTEPYSRREIIAVDIKGPIRTSHFDSKSLRQETYILVITDLFSRFTEIKFIKNIHSSTVCKILEEIWLKKHYIPVKCLTDNGRQFTSENFKNLMHKYGIKHLFIAPHNPTGNAIIERINREISVALRLSRGETLSKASNNIYMRLNMSNNSTLTFSPYEIFFKKPLANLKCDNFLIDDNEIKNAIKRRHEQWSTREIPHEVKYQKGDLVYIKVFNPDKIITKFEGPFRIVKISRSGNCAFIEKKNKVDKISVKNIKLFRKGEDVMDYSHYNTY